MRKTSQQWSVNMILATEAGPSDFVGRQGKLRIKAQVQVLHFLFDEEAEAVRAHVPSDDESDGEKQRLKHQQQLVPQKTGKMLAWIHHSMLLMRLKLNPAWIQAGAISPSVCASYTSS